MSTQAIGSNGYSDTASLLKAAKEEQQLQETASQASSKSETSSSTSWESRIRNDIQRYLSEVPKGEDGKLSFKDVDDYREGLEKEWDEAVKADLKKLGVDVSKEFPLSYDPTTGKVTVSGDHPDKALIDKYFEANPDKVEEFEKIVQLGKLTAVSNANFSPMELRQTIQQQSMAWWYEDNSDPTTWFNGGGMLVAQGQTSYTGLDLRV